MRFMRTLYHASRGHQRVLATIQSMIASATACHMISNRFEHQRRRWRTLFRRKAMGNLFRGTCC
jgi:hypothetical protein